MLYTVPGMYVYVHKMFQELPQTPGFRNAGNSQHVMNMEHSETE